MLHRAVLLSLIVHGFFLFSATYQGLTFLHSQPDALTGTLVQTKDAGGTQFPVTSDTVRKLPKSSASIFPLIVAASNQTSDSFQTGEPTQVVNDFRFALARQVKHFKNYPILAREQGWEGVVELDVRLIMGVPSVLLHQSSGFDILDREAKQMLLNALKELNLPRAMQEISVHFLLPIEFHLARE